MSKHFSLKQFIKYFGAAGIGYIADVTTLLIFTEVFKIHYLVSAGIGFCIGLLVVYIISGKYVFGASKLRSKSLEFALFAVIGIVGLLLLTLMMWFMTEFVNISYIAAKILATVVVYAWNFFARKSLYVD